MSSPTASILLAGTAAHPLQQGLPLLGVAVLGAAVLGAVQFFTSLHTPPPTTATHAIAPAYPTTKTAPHLTPEEVRRRIEPLLHEARMAAEGISARNAEAISAFLAAHSSGVVLFAQDVASLFGKCRAIWSKLPGTSADGHREFIRAKFQKHLFSEHDLQHAVSHAVTSQLDDLQNLESQLARKIRAELLNLFPQPSGSSCPLPNLEATLKQISATASHDSHTDAADFVTSEIPEQITEQTLTRIATSSGILVLGEAASTWTFGVGVAIALGADYLWDWITKPTADIASEVAYCIEELARTGTEALQSECSRLATKHCERWEEATQRLIAQLTPILGGA